MPTKDQKEPLVVAATERLRAAVPAEVKYHLRIAQWRARGRPEPPPHHVKQRELRKTAAAYDLRHLVETGTFLGHMLAAMRDHFDSLTSIELSEDLYERATEKFKDDPKVTILHGDSRDLLGGIVEAMDGSALFWLDAHYSGAWDEYSSRREVFEETAGNDRPNPIYLELQSIFSSAHDHVVLIDDARLFTGEEGWPSLEEILSFVEESEPGRSVTVLQDIIQVLPP